MKLNNKGFMLAEVTVVSAVIVVALITMYAGLNSLSSAYEIRNRYYDIDSLYMAMDVNDILIRENALPTGSINANEISSWLSNEEIKSEINAYKGMYNDTINFYIADYTSNDVNELKSKNSHQTFKDYMDYLENNLIFDDESYNYLIIVERCKDKNVDDCYYYALKLKY